MTARLAQHTLSQMIENLYPPKYLHRNDYSNLIHNGQKQKATKTSFNGKWLNLLHPHNKIPLNHEMK